MQKADQNQKAAELTDLMGQFMYGLCKLEHVARELYFYSTPPEAANPKQVYPIRVYSNTFFSELVTFYRYTLLQLSQK